eukprot:TRINITY_DN6791_c0_g1_i2.p1 TRINITY_DN6791_c0_g1~~TRINITY_DN6791_c0_g1_i2.p1  ORF type:complete len:2160 (-),score=454.18 TRINITY_DN6791_c0_g1_i2:155-6634(-)
MSSQEDVSADLAEVEARLEDLRATGRGGRQVAKSFLATLSRLQAKGELATCGRRVAACLAGLKDCRQSLQLKPLQLEAMWLETAGLLEQQKDWRLAWEITIGLVRHLAVTGSPEQKPRPDVGDAVQEALATAKVQHLRVHSAIRAASIFGQVSAGVGSAEILELCQYLSGCCRQAKELPSEGTAAPGPRKLLDWLVHLASSLTPACPANLAFKCWRHVFEALGSVGIEVHKSSGGKAEASALATMLCSQRCLSKAEKAMLLGELWSCRPQDLAEPSQQGWDVVAVEAALALIEVSQDDRGSRADSTKEQETLAKLNGSQQLAPKDVLAAFATDVIVKQPTTSSICLRILQACQNLKGKEVTDSLMKSHAELKECISSGGKVDAHALHRLLRALELLRRSAGALVAGLRPDNDLNAEAEPPSALLLCSLGELLLLAVRLADTLDSARIISKSASPLRTVSAVGKADRLGSSAPSQCLGMVNLATQFARSACELLCLALRSASMTGQAKPSELLRTSMALAKGAGEQATLLQLVNWHARQVKPSSSSAHAMAVALRGMLGVLVLQNDVQVELRQETPLLKSLASALETVTLHLRPASQAQVEEMLRWADSFLARLASSLKPEMVIALQPLVSQLLQVRLRALEDCRRNQPELMKLRRAEVFAAMRDWLLAHFEGLASTCQGLQTCSPSKHTALPEVSPALHTLLRLAGLGGAATVPALWHCEVRALEALRLRLPPGGPISAVLSLRQLELHHSFVLFAGEQPDLLASNVLALARLVLSQVGVELMMALSAQSSDDCDIRHLPLKAVIYVMEKCCGLLQVSAGCKDGLLNIGRLHLLQAQAALQLGNFVDAEEKPAAFARRALDAWQQHLGVQVESSIARMPVATATLLAAATPGSPDLLRELSDAAHLLELLDLHTMAADALVLALACVSVSSGCTSVWWSPLCVDLAAACQLPSQGCTQATLFLLYRLVAAVGRASVGQSSVHQMSAAWWHVAEAVRSKAVQASSSALALHTQRLAALAALPASFTSTLWFQGDNKEGENISLQEAMAAAVKTPRLEAGGMGLQGQLDIAEALWALAEQSMQWQDSTSHHQAPGGSALTAQCAALRSLTLLTVGGGQANTSQPHPGLVGDGFTSEVSLRWPMIRSGLLHLRVVHQVGVLYERFGVPHLADLSFQCGLRLVAQKLYGDPRWKLRFLCGRARLALAGYPSTAMSFGQLAQVPAARKLEEVLSEVENFSRRIGVLPTSTSLSEHPQKPTLDDQASISSFLPELLKLQMDLYPGTVDLSTCELNTAVQLLSRRYDSCVELWAERVAELARSLTELSTGHGRCRALLASAEACFKAATHSAGKGSTGPDIKALRHTLLRGSRVLRRSSRQLLDCDEIQRVCDVLAAHAKGGTAQNQHGSQAVSFASWLEVALLLAAAALRAGLGSGDALVVRRSAQLLVTLAHDASKVDPEAASLVSSSETTATGVFMVRSAVTKAKQLRKAKTWCVSRATAAAAAFEEDRSRSPPSRRRSPHDTGFPCLLAEAWDICKCAVPLCSGVTVLFLQELRSMQRSMGTLSQSQMVDYLFQWPHRRGLLEEDVCETSTTARGAVVCSEELSDGSWMSRVSSDISVAWLQVDHRCQSLQITRSIGGGGSSPAGHHAVVSQRIELGACLLQSIEEELRILHNENCSKVRQMSQRENTDKHSEAARKKFWHSCRSYDEQLGRVASRIQEQMLGAWQCLLAPWPQGKTARLSLRCSVQDWLDGEAATIAAGEFVFPQPPAVRSEQESAFARSFRCSVCDRADGEDVLCSCSSRFHVLALLFLDADRLEVPQIAFVLGSAVLLPTQGLAANGSNSRSSKLHRLASSLQRHRHELQDTFRSANADNENAEAPLMLFVDSVMAHLPLEACPCFRYRQVVRGLAPNVVLSSLARFCNEKPSSGFYVIDPADNLAEASVEVKSVLADLRSAGPWQGRIGKPSPEPWEVLEQLCSREVFVYLGHGECARQLLRQDQLQLGCLGAADATTPWPVSSAGSSSRKRCRSSSDSGSESSDSSTAMSQELRSILVLMGCSSAKMDKTAFRKERGCLAADFESFGIPSSALLGGSPLVVGAQWDVLAGDLDKLGSHLLDRWLLPKTEGPEKEKEKSFLRALVAARSHCELKHLTGAAVVCYGIPM